MVEITVAEAMTAAMGKSNVQVAITLNIPEVQATQFRFEYFRLVGLEELVSLYSRTQGELSSLLKLFDELVVKRRMSIEQIARVVEISLHRLPYMESLYEQAKREVDRLVEKRDYLLFDRNSLKKELAQLKEEEKKQRMLALPSYNNYYDNDKGGKKFPTETSSHYNYDRRPLLFMLPESPPSPELAY
jgi:hypothetical protein